MKGKKAYQRFLAKEEFKRTKQNKFTYALIDLDSDGIDELLIDSGGNCAGNMHYLLLKMGKVKKLLCVYREPFIVYDDGTLEYSMGHMDHVESSYYKIENGTIHKRMQMYGFWPGCISKEERKKSLMATARNGLKILKPHIRKSKLSIIKIQLKIEN